MGGPNFAIAQLVQHYSEQELKEIEKFLNHVLQSELSDGQLGKIFDISGAEVFLSPNKAYRQIFESIHDQVSSRKKI